MIDWKSGDAQVAIINKSIVNMINLDSCKNLIIDNASSVIGKRCNTIINFIDQSTNGNTNINNNNNINNFNKRSENGTKTDPYKLQPFRYRSTTRDLCIKELDRT